MVETQALENQAVEATCGSGERYVVEENTTYQANGSAAWFEPGDVFDVRKIDVNTTSDVTGDYVATVAVEDETMKLVPLWKLGEWLCDGTIYER